MLSFQEVQLLSAQQMYKPLYSDGESRYLPPVQFVAFLLSGHCLCNVSSHLFNVWAECTPASGTNHCYASTLVRGIPSLKSSEYCGSCSNHPFPQWIFFLSLSLGMVSTLDSSSFPTNHSSGSQANLLQQCGWNGNTRVELFGLVTSCCLLE